MLVICLLSWRRNSKVRVKKCIIILDEIQEVKRGLSVLKYFCEDAPEYHVAVAGSLYLSEGYFKACADFRV